MNADFDVVLDECLRDLRAGSDVQACLARYPEHAQALRPLLEVAVDLSSVVTPSPSTDARAAGRRQMQRALAEKKRQAVSRSLFSRYAGQIARTLTGRELRKMTFSGRLVAAIVAAMLVLASVATGTASADSLPGDTLYPVKRMIQRAQVALTLDVLVRQELRAQFDAQQRQEIRTALEEGRQAKVTFQGILQRVEDDTWVVGELPVIVQGDTTIEGEPELGEVLEVRGRLPGDSTLVANRLAVREPATGAFDSPLLGDEPTTTPELDDDEGSDEPGTMPEPTETPEPTATPEPTSTVEPTATPEPTSTVGPTETPEPTATPKPTSTLEPTATPEPTSTVGPTKTPEPTVTPEPTSTVEPTRTPEPEETEEAEETPEPTRTPEPEETEEAEDTPEPTGTPKPDETEEAEETPEPEETEEAEETPEPTKTKSDDDDD